MRESAEAAFKPLIDLAWLEVVEGCSSQEQYHMIIGEVKVFLPTGHQLFGSPKLEAATAFGDKSLSTADRDELLQRR